MGFLFKVALRNVLRQKFRTALSALVVLSGVWVLIMGQGFIGGLRENIIKASVDTMAGHVSLRPVDYPTNTMEHPIDHLFAVTPEMVAHLDSIAMAWTTRIYANADAISYPNSLRVKLIGFDPVKDALVFPREDWRIEGELPASNGVALSKGLADLFELEVGEFITLSLRTPAGSLNAATLEVKGIYNIGNPVLDGTGILVPQTLMAQLMNSDAISHVSVRLQRRGETVDAASRLSEHYGDTLEVVTWIDATKELLELQEIRQKSLNFLVFILLGIAGLGIANTILMAAFERMREIGTLRAMGMTRRRVLSMFLIEGGLIGLLGGFLGSVLGAAPIYYWAQNPIDMSPLIEDKGAGNFPISVFLYTEFSWAVVFGSFVFGVVIAVLSSIYPSFVATRMSPADAVRAD